LAGADVVSQPHANGAAAALAGFQSDAGIVEAVPFLIEDALAMQQGLVA
jgi:hypothetical protein